MLRCYYVTLAYVRTPLKNRKYISYKIYLYICGGVGLFLVRSAQHLRNTSITTPTPREGGAKNPSNLRFEGVFAFGRMFRRLSEKSRSEGRFWAFYEYALRRFITLSKVSRRMRCTSLIFSSQSHSTTDWL